MRLSSIRSSRSDAKRCGPRRSAQAPSTSATASRTAELTDEEAAALQDRHLAFRADLRERGYLLCGGPLVDEDDERLRTR